MPAPVKERTPGLIEAFKGRNPRVLFFHFAVAVLLIVLAVGLGYQQLGRTDVYHEREKVQNQRRILVPGPRGNIYDREGRLLVGNRPQFAVVLYLDELRGEMRREYLKIRKAYRESGDKDLPTASQMARIARFAVVDRYLQQVNRALGREKQLDSNDLNQHMQRELLLPYTLIDDLAPAEYARLIEQLPVTSPLQVYTSSARFYPFGSAAAHTLGSVKVADPIGKGEDFPNPELASFKMQGTLGRDGLEARFDTKLQGETGGTIYRVDPAGYRVEPPLMKRLPVQGSNIVTSLDIDLQLAAEVKLAENEMAGAAVAIDVQTGEILTLASKPDYDLNATSPRISSKLYKEIEEQGGWYNRALSGLYPPGSSFKILTTIAGMRAGWLTPDSEVDCPGYYMVGRKQFDCHDRHAHGQIKLATALEKSCNVYFYKYGIQAGAQAIADESRRFGFGQPTGIELLHETRRTVVPDDAWKRKTQNEPWFPGDTAMLSIGQSYLLVTPVQMAAFMASFARGQIHTSPTLIHAPDRLPQRSEPIGLSAENYAGIVRGMEQCTITGTAKVLSSRFMKIPGLRIAGKTGTAQKRTEKGMINFAWFIGYAPIERPQIAFAIVVEGDQAGEETGGGTYAVPVAQAILKTWAEKQQKRASATLAATP